MNGTKGFRARAAAASYQRRQRRLVSEDVRELRAANLSGPSFHGDPEEAASAAVKPTQEQAARASAAALALKEAATQTAVDTAGAADKADDADTAAAELAAAEEAAAELAAAETAAAEAAAAKTSAAEKAAAEKKAKAKAAAKAAADKAKTSK